MAVISGRKPVLEALKAGKPVEKVYLQKGTKGDIIESVMGEARRRNIKVFTLDPNKFKSISKHPNSQGVAAIARFHDDMPVEKLIDYSLAHNKLLLLLEHVQDTHNLGAILRTAECAGVDGVILTQHHSAPVNETVMKTSAGAASIIKLSSVNNATKLLPVLKEAGFWMYGASLGEGARDYREADFNRPVVLIVGNEEKGMKRLTQENCDELLYIPMAGEIDSLNVSVATGVMLFEALRQRKTD